MFWVVAGLILVALFFDYINGFHDAANSIATIVSTRVLPPRWAVAWAAFFNFIAFVIFPLHVAHTIGKGIIDPAIVNDRVLLSALGGAIAWNLITWFYGLPSSSSHALVGGLIGAGVAKVGVSAIVWSGLAKTSAAIVLSPLSGFVLAMLIFLAVSWLFVRHTPYAVDRLFRSLQFVSASLYSLGHGGNDAQKTMGIITLAILLDRAGTGGQVPDSFDIPVWVIVSAAAVMGFGTMIGGWRVVRTLGLRITRLEPVQGFAAETGAALVITGAARLGIPVSTTHAIGTSIMGVGATRRFSAVRWGVAGQVVAAWILTWPTCMVLGYILETLFGSVF
jgi:PiT family inorganic phosphate transporter